TCQHSADCHEEEAVKVTHQYLLLGCAGLVALDAAAQAYPSKNVTMIVPYPAGGSIDLYARAIAQELGKAWGKNVLIDNRGVSSGMIGTEVATKMDHDGHV